MVDVRKIDDFFNNPTLFERKAHQRLTRRERYVRFFKLFMPSVAALLIGVILLFVNLKKNTFVQPDKIRAPKLEDIDKLYVEKTSFSMTDIDGKITSFTADLMEETEKGSKIIKIENPKGKIALNADDKFADVKADIGFYNQEENKIEAKQNVVVIYDQSTTLKTNSAEYDFSKALGEGNHPVYAEGDWGKLWAEGFLYDKKEDKLYLIGKTKIVHEESVLDALEQVVYSKNLNQIEAIGNVVVTQPDKTLYADRAVIYLDNSSKQTILKKIEAFQNVIVKTGDGQIKGDYGVYEPNNNLLELSGNVEMKKDNNLIYGDKATFDMLTSVFKLISKSKQDRVSGVIRNSSIKALKNEKTQ